MSDPAAPPKLIRYVRSALRVDPKPSFEDVLGRWRKVFGSELETELIRTVYDQELARAVTPRQRDPRHTQIVLFTVGLWLLGHVALALALGLPEYVTCRQSPQQYPTNCGSNLGVTFLVVGLVQAFYGVIVGIIAARIRPAVAQGVFIGLGIVVPVFTVVCFGVALSA
jgi:hypothetical protein